MNNWFRNWNIDNKNNEKKKKKNKTKTRQQTNTHKHTPKNKGKGKETKERQQTHQTEVLQIIYQYWLQQNRMNNKQIHTQLILNDCFQCILFISKKMILQIQN